MRSGILGVLAVVLLGTGVAFGTEKAPFKSEKALAARSDYLEAVARAETDRARRAAAEAYIAVLKQAQDQARDRDDMGELIGLETEIQRVTPASPKQVVRKTPPADIRVFGGGFKIEQLKEHAKAFVKGNYTWRGLPEELVGARYTQVRTGGSGARIRVALRSDGTVRVATSSPEKLLKDGWVKTGETFGCNHHKFTEMVVLTRAFKKDDKFAIDQDGPSGVIVILPKNKK